MRMRVRTSVCQHTLPKQKRGGAGRGDTKRMKRYWLGRSCNRLGLWGGGELTIRSLWCPIENTKYTKETKIPLPRPPAPTHPGPNGSTPPPSQGTNPAPTHPPTQRHAPRAPIPPRPRHPHCRRVEQPQSHTATLSLSHCVSPGQPCFDLKRQDKKVSSTPQNESRLILRGRGTPRICPYCMKNHLFERVVVTVVAVCNGRSSVYETVCVWVYALGSIGWKITRHILTYKGIMRGTSGIRAQL